MTFTEELRQLQLKRQEAIERLLNEQKEIIDRLAEVNRELALIRR